MSMGAPTSPPQPVRLAVTLMYVLAALAAVDIVLSSFVIDTASQVEAAGVPAGAAGVAIAFAVVVGLIAVTLWVLCAVFTGRGQQWARIVATVLAGLGILGGLFTLATAPFAPDGAGVQLITPAVRLVIEVVLVVLLWRPLANRFFAARSGRATAA